MGPVGMHAMQIVLGTMLTSAPPSLDSLRDVQSLSPDQAAQARSVRLEGATLSFVNTAPFATYVFLQQGSEGIYGQLDEGLASPPAGRSVVVEATTRPGEFAPSLQIHTIEDHGPAEPLRTQAEGTEDLMTGLFDGSWVGIEGVVRRRETDEGGALHILVLGGAAHGVRVELPLRVTESEVAALVGARIRAEGACGARFNERRQLVGARVLAPSLRHVRIIEGAPDVMSLPVQAAGSLLEFDPGHRKDGLTRLRGQIIHTDPSMWVLQDASGAVVVRPQEASTAKLGSHVEIIGYAETRDLMPTLVDAYVISSRPDELAPPTVAQDPRQRNLWLSWTRVSGRVRDVSPFSSGGHLTLTVDGLRLPVTIQSGHLSAAVRQGAEVEVDGVIYPRWDELEARQVSEDLYALAPNSLELLAVDAAQLRVVADAPFWTAGRSGTLALTLLTVVGFAALWLLALRGRVRAQTETIRAQLATQEKLRVEAQAASRAKSLFLSTMSHELRTPLHGVLGGASLLAERPGLDTTGKELVEAIRGSGLQLQNIIRDILDLSRAEAGQLSISPTRVEIRAVLTAAVDEIRPMAEAKGLVLTTSFDEALPDWVSVDDVRLRQITQNLLDNALKFTERGRVHLRAGPLGEEAIEVSVADSGIGIPAEEQARLFGRFQQVDGAVTRRFGGAGLGLAVCRELAELMGGSIRVESELEMGSTFSFDVQAPQAPSPTSQPEPEKTPDVRGLRVLVVDDNLLNRRIAGAMLETLSCETAFAEDGREAFERATTEAFDLVLMDLHMPELDGLQSTKKILEVLGARAPPILALTADTLPETRAEAKAVGMFGYLTKPLTLDELRAALEANGMGGSRRVTPAKNAASRPSSREPEDAE